MSSDANRHRWKQGMKVHFAASFNLMLGQGKKNKKKDSVWAES